ncbi:MAG: hypothetical protein RL670_859 [Actinomycetota bacterium]
MLGMGLLFYFPLARVLVRSLGAWHLDGVAAEVIWFTVWQAAVSTAIALVLALPIAHLLYRRSFLGRNLLLSLVTVPFVLPVIVVAIGFASLRHWFGFGDAGGGGDSIPWIIAAHVFFNVAVLVRGVGPSWAALDPQMLEAARVDGASGWRSWWFIQLPQLRGAIASASALVILYCLTSFGTVLLLGGGQVHSIETEIYVSVSQYLDLGRVGLLTLVQLALGWAAFWMAGRAVILADAGETIRGRLRGLGDRLAFVFGWVVVAALTLPMIAVVLASFGSSPGAAMWQNYANLGGQGARDVLNVSVAQAAGNSLRNLLLTFLVGFGGGVAIARGLAFRRVRGWHSVFMLPMATSAVVLGLGYLLAFARSPLNLLDSWAAVPLAQALIVLPLVIRLVQPAIQASDRHLLEAAQVDGANVWRTWWLIQVPILRPALAAAAAMAALSAIGEFGAASMLVYGDQETLPTVLYRLMARPGTENFGMAMAASTLLIMVSLAVVLVLTASETQRSGRQPRSERA